MMTSLNLEDRNDVLYCLLVHSYQEHGNSEKIAIRKKDLGRWKSYTWKDYHQNVIWLALGLLELGLEHGDKVAILGDNDPELNFAEMGTLSIGAVITVIFVDSTPPEIKYILNHSESKIVFAKDQEAVDKVLSIMDEVPTIRKVIYWDPKGLWSYTESVLMSWEELIQLGQSVETEKLKLFQHAAERVQPDDLAVLMYTSGTTGLPKAVMHSHNTARAATRAYQSFWPIEPYFEELFYISPAWATGHVFMWRHLAGGHTLDFPENPQTVQENTREMAPHSILYPSRLWEDLISTINRKIGDSGRLNRWAYKQGLKVGYKVADCHFNKVKPDFLSRMAYTLWHAIVLRPIKDDLGLIRIEHAFTSGGSLGPDSFRFLRALGLNIKQVYGSTEINLLSGHTDNDVKFESVGRKQCDELVITDAGEIIAKDRSMFIGYYKDVELYHESVKDNWFYTGDAGYIDDDEHLIFWDRLNDLRELKSGAKFSPLYIESRLKFSPYIRDAICVGGNREYVAVMIAIDFENVGKWAERQKIAYTTFVDLSQRPEVLYLIIQEIQVVNNTLPDWSRVIKMINLPKELDPDEAELTRTRKLRRGLIEERYSEIIEAIYEGREEMSTQVKVQYRDGTEKFIQAKLIIMSI